MVRALFFIGIITLTLTNWLQADLVWTEDTGWRVEGGALMPLIGIEEGEAANAIELMNDAKQAYDNDKEWSALSTYKSVYKKYPKSILAPEAHFQRGIIYTETHQFEKANKEFDKIIRRYPDYEKFNQVIGRIYTIGEKIVQGERPHYWGLIPGFRNYELGSKILEGIIEKAPYSEYAPIALMNIAIIAQKRNRPEEAIDALDRLINNYPQNTFAQDAYLNLATTYADLVQGADYDQGATREAISYFEDFITLYPNSPASVEAEAGLQRMQNTLAKSKLILGDFYYKYRNNNRAALVLYNEAITTDPRSASAEKAQEMIDKINNGVPAPSTPVDWMFGRYQSPVSRDELPVEKAPSEAFETFQPEFIDETTSTDQ